MLRATYDTNTLVSGAVTSQGAVSVVIDAWINDEVDMITSQSLIEELTRTLTKPYFRARLTQEQIEAFIDLVITRATVVQINVPIPKIATHPEDDIVLATVISGGASYSVTGDHGLQSLKEFKGIQIVNPVTFTKILQRARAA
ncbi:MAG: putative toxin-antitoxin system toxin component, PIN family [Candidatus Levyibacteriota bacterium]